MCWEVNISEVIVSQSSDVEIVRNEFLLVCNFESVTHGSCDDANDNESSSLAIFVN